MRPSPRTWPRWCCVADAVVHALDLDAADDEAVPRFDGRVWDALGLTSTQAQRVFERTETGVTTLAQALAV